jgi:hypothetical protein
VQPELPTPVAPYSAPQHDDKPVKFSSQPHNLRISLYTFFHFSVLFSNSSSAKILFVFLASTKSAALSVLHNAQNLITPTADYHMR